MMTLMMDPEVTPPTNFKVAPDIPSAAEKGKVIDATTIFYNKG